MMTFRLSKIAALAFCLFGAQIGTAQDFDLDRIEQRLDSLESRYQQIQLVKKQLSTRGDSLAAIIHTLKAKSDRSFVEEHELENQLRVSQTIAGSTQAAYQNEALLLHELTVFAEKAFKNLNASIKILTENLQSAKDQNDAAAVKRLAGDLQRATILRSRCQGYLNAPPGNLPLIHIQISASDSPKQIKEKADFLLDQSDRFKKASEQIENKLKELSDEIDLRDRLSDFVDDLAAFDPATETVAGAGRRSANAAASETSQLNDSETRTSAGQPFALSHATQHLSDDWPTNIATLSTEDLESWLKQLQSQQRTLDATADSLAQKSAAFRKILDTKQP